MTSSFQLLRLPQLAIQEVLNLLEVKEQVLFALCSKRAKNVFKFLRNKKVQLKIVVDRKYRIAYDIISNGSHTKPVPLIHAFSKQYGSLGNIEKVEMGNSQIDVFVEKNCNQLFLRTYWEDENIGIKILSDFICDLFRADIYLLEISEAFGKRMEIFREKPVEILAIHSTWDPINADDFEFILSNSKAKFLFVNNGSNYFIMERHQSKFAKSLMADAYCMSSEYLMNLECAETKINHRPYSSEEINEFLVHWSNGGYPRLKCLCSPIVGSDIDQFLALEANF